MCVSVLVSPLKQIHYWSCASSLKNPYLASSLEICWNFTKNPPLEQFDPMKKIQKLKNFIVALKKSEKKKKLTFGSLFFLKNQSFTLFWFFDLVLRSVSPLKNSFRASIEDYWRFEKSFIFGALCSFLKKFTIKVSPLKNKKLNKI